MAFYSTSPSKSTSLLAGTPHCGVKAIVGELRKTVRNLVSALECTGWSADHPIGTDEAALGLIDLVEELGPSELHALRIITAMLVRVAWKNGFHAN